MIPGADLKVGIDALPAHAERVDVRTPSEFAVDRIPGAVNLPVLDDAQRAEVGTMHAKVSAFAARRHGAALVSRNIAAILETYCADKPRAWSPLVYCWRGGKRSASLAHVLKEIGFRAVQLQGGYQTYRRHVVARLATLPQTFDYVVVCGLTGSGKSRFLRALADAGGQVLDLEGMAKHRGSLLGDLPHDPQPSQKGFESTLLAALGGLDRARPVFVESESRRIGSVQLPDSLLASMRAGRCVKLLTPQALRVAILKEDYAHFLRDPAALAGRFERLLPLHGRKTIERWTEAAQSGDFDALVEDLLARHYDPKYARSIESNFPASAQALEITPASASPAALAKIARDVVTSIERIAEPTP